MDSLSKIYIAGHTGLVGSALLRKLRSAGYENIIFYSHKDLDLTQQADVDSFFKREKPEYVFLAAAKVGGIHANTVYPAEFIYNNLAIQINVLHAAWKTGVKRLIFFGSSCIYPKECPQPIREEDLLTGPLEPSSQPYALAKIAGISQCDSYNRQHKTKFLPVMPATLYGPNDNFKLQESHVLPALIRKFHLARLASIGDWTAINKDETILGPVPEDVKASLASISKQKGHNPIINDSKIESSDPSIILWGSGQPRREFLHVDDLSECCIFLMNLNDDQFDDILFKNSCPYINIGSGEDVTIKDLSSIVRNIVGFAGDLKWDKSRPDGTPRKLLDISRINSLGWHPGISLEEGIKKTYKWYETLIT